MGRIFKVAKGAISYGRIFLINMIETHLEYLDKHITISIEGSYKECMIYRRVIRLKVVILVTDYTLENHADG